MNLSPAVCGWAESGFGWRSRGERIGWVDGDDMYLEPQVAFASAQKLGRDGGQALAVGSTTLLKRLRDNNLLASWDPKRKRLTVRRTLDGTRRDVLHLKTESILPQQKPSQPSQSSHFHGEYQPGESPEGEDEGFYVE